MCLPRRILQLLIGYSPSDGDDNLFSFIRFRIYNILKEITEEGAKRTVIFPYSPDKSPIEYGFKFYKQHLERHSKRFTNWYDFALVCH